MRRQDEHSSRGDQSGGEPQQSDPDHDERDPDQLDGKTHSANRTASRLQEQASPLANRLACNYTLKEHPPDPVDLGKTRKGTMSHDHDHDQDAERCFVCRELAHDGERFGTAHVGCLDRLLRRTLKGAEAHLHDELVEHLDADADLA